MLQAHYGHLDLLNLADKFAREGSVAESVLNNHADNDQARTTHGVLL